MSNARNLAKVAVDANGDIGAASLDNVPPSNDASALTTGTLDTARIADTSISATKLASGAAASNLGNYVSTVNGQTGAVTISSSPTTAQVLAATAGASGGAVGSYAFVKTTGNIGYFNSTMAGSQLKYSNTNNDGGATPPGTWRIMAHYLDHALRAGIALRIS